MWDALLTTTVFHLGSILRPNWARSIWHDSSTDLGDSSFSTACGYTSYGGREFRPNSMEYHYKIHVSKNFRNPSRLPRVFSSDRGEMSPLRNHCCCVLEYEVNSVTDNSLAWRGPPTSIIFLRRSTLPVPTYSGLNKASTLSTGFSKRDRSKNRMIIRRI